MRYFKYDGEIPDREAIRKRGKELSGQLQRQCRKAKTLWRLGTLVFLTVVIILSAGLIFLSLWLLPEEDGVFISIINFLCKGVLCCMSLIVAAIIGAIAAGPLWGKQYKTEKVLLRQALTESCTELRQFYQFGEPFLVTKCYRSSDKHFDRHDVCLFVVDGELRLTANMHYGFFDPKRDLGCYSLTRQEVCLTDGQYKGRSAVELSAGGVTFTLGTKAHPFVEKYFLSDNRIKNPG